jgi:hypothetical protein
MEKIIGLVVIGIIFFTAWIFNSRHDKVSVNKNIRQNAKAELQNAETKVTRRSQIRSYGTRHVYPPLHPEEKKKRLEGIRMKKYNFNLQGITWDSVENRYYWNTHKLAMEHK